MVELATIAAGLTVASAAIKLSKSIAEVVSKEDRQTATKLTGLMTIIHTNAADIRNYLKRVKRAKSQETKDQFLTLALGKIEQMLLAIRDTIRLLTRIWSRPSLAEKFFAAAKEDKEKEKIDGQVYSR